MEYFRKSFEDFTGISSAAIGKQLYTLEESMERYSINLAYWYIQLEMEKTEPNVKYSKGIQPKSMFIKSQIIRIINIIKDIFPSNLTPTIHQKAIDIKNNNVVNNNNNNLNK